MERRTAQDSQPKINDRVANLVVIESDLVRKLEQCVPPVDQHRRELERVRDQIANLRSDTNG